MLYLGSDVIVDQVNAQTNLFSMFARKDMVVLVNDRIRTLSFAVMGECACASVNGLKLRMVETILLATEALLLTREPRLFRVAVTMRASLQKSQTQLSQIRTGLRTCCCLE